MVALFFRLAIFYISIIINDNEKKTVIKKVTKQMEIKRSNVH